MVNVQKHKLFPSLLLLTITGIFSACTDETEQIGIHNGTPIDINVGVNTESRAVITGNSLPDGSQIGVTVVDKTGTGYQSQDYNNVCYQAVNEDGAQIWKVQSRGDILLSGETGTLYAYYPWAEAVNNIKQIAVDVDEGDQKDWMVAQPVTDLSDAQATAAIKMQHMLSNFKLSFYKDNYSGKGVVSAVTIRSNGFATTGTLDATTGAFTGYGDTHTLTREFATTLGTDKASAAPCNIMVVPNTVAAPVTVCVTVDGKTYSSVTSSLALAKGKSYNYAMKLSSTGLDITEVSVTDWQTRDLGETEFKPVGGNQSSAYSDWIILTYKVDDASRPINIFGTHLSMDYVAGMMIQENTSRAAGEPQVVTPSVLYTFSNIGEHTVYIKFKDETKIPPNSFDYCSNITSVIFPNSVQIIESQAFIGCVSLKEITFGTGLKKIETCAFNDCAVLAKMTFNGTTAPKFYTDVLVGIDTDEGIIIVPKGCEAAYENFKAHVFDMLIYNVWKCLEEGYVYEDGLYYSEDEKTLLEADMSVSGDIVIKEGVTKIAAYAFYRCADITSVTMPASLKSIAPAAFYGCI